MWMGRSASARAASLREQHATRGLEIVLALQLHFSFEMCGACFGLMGAPPQ
jgi:hypothetical protein